VFKLDTGNDLGISYKWYGFKVERSKVKVRVRVTVNSNTTWVRILWVPSSRVILAVRKYRFAGCNCNQSFEWRLMSDYNIAITFAVGGSFKLYYNFLLLLWKSCSKNFQYCWHWPSRIYLRLHAKFGPTGFNGLRGLKAFSGHTDTKGRLHQRHLTLRAT